MLKAPTLFFIKCWIFLLRLLFLLFHFRLTVFSRNAFPKIFPRFRVGFGHNRDATFFFLNVRHFCSPFILWLLSYPRILTSLPEKTSFWAFYYLLFLCIAAYIMYYIVILCKFQVLLYYYFLNQICNIYKIF